MRTVIRWLLSALLGLGLLICIGVVAFRVAGQMREDGDELSDAPSKGRFVAAEDVEIFLQELGPADGPVLVFTHGAGAWSEAWRSAMVVLAKAGYRCISLDVPPFGFSRRPNNADYSAVAQARRLGAALDSLKVQRFALVAHSIGSRPAMELALTNSERVSAVVLVSAALSLDQDPSAKPGALASTLLNSRLLREALIAAVATNPSTTDFMVSKLVAKPLAKEDIAMFQRPMHRQGTMEAWGEWAREVGLAQSRSASMDSKRYKSFAAPTLLLWGERDLITPIEQGKDLALILPYSILLVLDGVGHIPQLEDRQRVDLALLTFFQNTLPLPDRGHAAVAK